MWNINALNNFLLIERPKSSPNVYMQHVNQTSLQVMVCFQIFNYSNKNEYSETFLAFPVTGTLSEFPYKYPQYKFNLRDLFSKGRCSIMYTAKCELAFG